MYIDITDSDIKLCYFGGSGGFVMLHLMILSNAFHCSFATNQSISEVIEYQWKIPSPDEWKSREINVDNESTRATTTNKRKIFFFCNPNIEEVSKFNGKVVFLYTDARTQLLLSQYKKAYLFRLKHSWSWMSHYRFRLTEWRQHYNNIKDTTWPNCTGPNGFSRLPDVIKKEVLKDPYTEQCLNITHINDLAFINYYLDDTEKMSNGDVVLPEVFNFFKYADVSIKLNDVMTDLDTLTSITGVPVNQQQIKLRNHWASLHPVELLRDVELLGQSS